MGFVVVLDRRRFGSKKFADKFQLAPIVSLFDDMTARRMDVCDVLQHRRVLVRPSFIRH